MAKSTSTMHFGPLYGSSQAMLSLYRQIERVSTTEATVFLEGESGTGKELIAQSIHFSSQRADKQFVAVNCGAIPDHLIEAALFGYEKGSFTGALRMQAGYFEHASGGTLFLDEITEMPPDLQVKILRVLECGNFYRVGGSDAVQVNVRLIAATNRSLKDAVQTGSLRQDLMYRLAVFPIRVPPLRERGNDTELLANHFLEELNREAATSKRFSKSALKQLHNHHWPGNVRELKNLVHRAFILSKDVLTLEIPTVAGKKIARVIYGIIDFTIGTTLADVQKEIILATLNHFRGNKRLTAEALGISLKTLYNRLKAY
jgi:DNA-binding NtrC family response regulator